MTKDTKTDQMPPENEQQSSLLAEPYPKIRVLPAQLARMMEVSKQCVSQWVQIGKITLGPDGRIDPEVAMRQVLENTHPGRLRAKILKPLAGTTDGLRRRLAECEERITYLEEFSVELDLIQLKFIQLIVHRWPELSQLDISEIAGALDELSDLASLITGGYEDDPTQTEDEGDDNEALQ